MRPKRGPGLTGGAKPLYSIRKPQSQGEPELPHAQTIVGLAGAALALLAAPALASPLETAFEARLTAVAAVGEADGGPDLEPLTARADLYVDALRTLDNGADLGLTLAFAAEQDHPGRDPRGGAVPGAPVDVQGAISGFSGAGQSASHWRADVESAFLFVKGGWGEATLGWDEGAAARFSLAPPQALRTVSAFEDQLDPTGLGAPVLRNDLSGASAKLTAATPRLLGVRAGLSFAPQAQSVGLDQGFEPRAGLVQLEPEQILEAGVSFSRVWRSGWETSAALTYATAQAGGPAPFGRIETWGGGARFGLGGWRFGAAGLVSDGGAPGADYDSFGAGLARDLGDWTFALSAGSSEDELAGVKLETASAEIQKRFGEGFALGAALRSGDRRTRTDPAQRAKVLLFELTWSL